MDLVTKNWWQPELAYGDVASPMQAMRRRNFMDWIGIPGPTPYFREDNEVTWTGAYLQISPRMLGMMAHEIGHWLVASPARRELPDFGLGDLSNDPSVLFHLPYDRMLEEHCAVLLGASICDALGIPDVIVGAVKFSGWGTLGSDERCWKAYRWLGQHKMICAGDYRLTGKCRTWADGETEPMPETPWALMGAPAGP